MHRLAVFLLAVLALGAGGLSNSAAAVLPYQKLSMAEQIALQESEQRVSHYDLELRALDRERMHRRISADAYQWDTSELTFCIQQESLFQNAILVRRSRFPQNTKAALETMEHAVLAVPVGVGYVVAACPQLLELLACIH